MKSVIPVHIILSFSLVLYFGHEVKKLLNTLASQRWELDLLQVLATLIIVAYYRMILKFKIAKNNLRVYLKFNLKF